MREIIDWLPSALPTPGNQAYDPGTFPDQVSNHDFVVNRSMLTYCAMPAGLNGTFLSA